MLKHNWPVVNAYKMIIFHYIYLPFRAISVGSDLFEIPKAMCSIILMGKEMFIFLLEKVKQNWK